MVLKYIKEISVLNYVDLNKPAQNILKRVNDFVDHKRHGMGTRMLQTCYATDRIAST
jgi:hypothetical protein